MNEKRPVGRPTLGRERMTESLHITVSAATKRRVTREAKSLRMSAAAYVRDLIQRALRGEK